MSIRVKKNRHGFLALRIRRKGMDKGVGTKLRDDGKHGPNRRRLEAIAVLVEADLKGGKPLHRALYDRLGDCPLELLPGRKDSQGNPRGITAGQYYPFWIERQRPPLVRKTQARKHRLYFDSVILPFLGDVPLVDLDARLLRDFQARLFERKIRGRPIRVKTARNIVDGHLRALYRDARDDFPELSLGNPFANLRWPRQIEEPPDPFTVEERDKILAFYCDKRPFWFPMMFTLFYTGMRPGELAALRLPDVDLERGKISITKSRDSNEDGPPKTPGSRREIELLPNVVEILRTVEVPANAAPDTFFFRNPEGGPVTTQWWPKKSWKPVLKKLGVRYRKFYSTRHSFISWALTEGMNIKALAEYCGNSVEMIERRYGRYIAGSGLGPLAQSVAKKAAAKEPERTVIGSRRRFVASLRQDPAYQAMIRRARARLVERAKTGTFVGTLSSARREAIRKAWNQRENENGPARKEFEPRAPCL